MWAESPPSSRRPTLRRATIRLLMRNQELQLMSRNRAGMGERWSLTACSSSSAGAVSLLGRLCGLLAISRKRRLPMGKKPRKPCAEEKMWRSVSASSPSMCRSPRAYCSSRVLPSNGRSRGGPHDAVRALGADEPGRLRLLQPAVAVAEHYPHRVRIGGEHVLRQPNQVDAPLDPDPLLLDRRAQDTLGLGLRNEQEVVIAGVDPREVEPKDALASAIAAGGGAGGAEPD